MPSIGAAGDYTTITAWEAAADVSAGIWLGNIIDAAEFAENVVISGPVGVPSAANYVYLTVDPSVRHSGKAGTTHARMRSAAGGHIITVSESFTRIEYLEIQQASSGVSDEGVRFTSGVSDCILSRSIIHCEVAIADQDGLYAGNWAVTNINIDHCLIYGFGRAGINAQNYNGANAQTWNADYCTISDCGLAGETESAGIHSRTGASGASVTISAYNTACLANGTAGSDYNETTVAGATNTWVGSNNADSDGSLTGKMSVNTRQNLTRTSVSQTTGSWFVVNNDTLSTLDMQLLDDAAGNLAYGNGVDRVGSEPDARQDFSLDIAGNTRSTTSPAPDIGASEYLGGASLILKTANDAFAASVAGSANNILAALNRADSSSLSLLEANSLLAFLQTTADTLSVSVIDVVQAVSVVLSAADTVSAAIAESSSTDVLLSRSDALSASVAESVFDLLGALTRTDGLSMSVADINSLAVMLSSADLFSASITEGVSVVTVALAVADVLDLSIADASVAAFVLLSRGDAVSASLSESISILAYLDRSDGLTASVVDVSALVVVLNALDGLSASLGEGSVIYQAAVSTLGRLRIKISAYPVLLAEVNSLPALKTKIESYPALKGEVTANGAE